MLRSVILILLVTVTSPAWTADQQESIPEQSKGEESESPERAQMNKIIKESLGLAVKTISENSGGIYPYGMTMNGEGKMNLKGFSGKKEEAPSQEDWFKSLHHSLRKATSSDKDIVAAAITRLHQIKNDQGKQVPGVWILADHRNNRPWVAFFPLVKQDNGKRKVGDPAYQATENWLFSEEAGQTASSENPED